MMNESDKLRQPVTAEEPDLDTGPLFFTNVASIQEAIQSGDERQKARLAKLRQKLAEGAGYDSY